MMNRLLPFLLTLACLAPVQAAVFSDEDLVVARELRASALEGTGAFDIVADLTTRVGPRLAGSEADARAVAWARAMLEDMGFDRVWLEPATFPTWSRGTERASVVSPVSQNLVAIALGFSPPTPEGGIRAEVVMMEDFDALEAADAADIDGRIVFVRNRMERARDGSGYGPAVIARAQGPMVAAEKGALALLIRSIGTSDNRFAHTGAMRFDLNTRTIPSAAISNPDADQLARLVELGEPVTIELELSSQVTEPFTSYNVLAEITGSDRPEEIVALGAHLDSWDVGTGALDDGAGVAIVTEAARRILALERRPRRSIQVILFAAEEIGLWGGRAWRDANRDKLENYQIAAESDFGAGPVYQIDARVSDAAWPVIEAIQRELEPLGIALGERDAGGGPDFLPMRAEGLAVASLRQDGTHYFDYHHTENDTLDKIVPEELDQNVAAYTVFAWLSAQAPLHFGSGPELAPEPEALPAVAEDDEDPDEAT